MNYRERKILDTYVRCNYIGKQKLFHDNTLESRAIISRINIFQNLAPVLISDPSGPYGPRLGLEFYAAGFNIGTYKAIRIFEI